MATSIPYPVQELWLADILLPALIAASHKGSLEYVDYTLPEWQWKAANKDSFSNAKMIPLSPKAMLQLQENIHHTIQFNTSEYGMFGSFFFVGEVKGCKLLTKDGQGDYKDPYRLSKLKCLPWTLTTCQSTSMASSSWTLASHSMQMARTH